MRRDGSEKSTHGTSTRSDVVPVKTESEHAETFVTGSTTEDTSEPGRLAVGKTEDTDTGKGSGAQTLNQLGHKIRWDLCDIRCDVLGEPFINEHKSGDKPEEFHSLVLKCHSL